VKVVSVSQRRKAVRHLMSLYRVSERRACLLTGLKLLVAKSLKASLKGF
jgi:hypothetical protein